MVCLAVLLGACAGTWGAEVFEPGKGWQPTESREGSGTGADLTTDVGQLEHARVLWEAGKLKRCRQMGEAIIKAHGSGEAVEQAWVLQVKTEAALGDLSAGEKHVAEFRKRFPGSGNSSLMADAEMDLLERKARTGDKKTLKRLEKMVEENPYGARADRAQLLVGHIHLKKRDYQEARDAYEVVLSAYPQSRYRLEAEFGKGKSTYLANQGVLRDAGFYIEAEQILKGVLEDDPEFPERAEAEKYLKEIHERLAERQYRVGRYYQGQHRPESAGVYYRDVIRRFEDTSWSAKAKKELAKLKLPGPETPEKPVEAKDEATEEKTVEKRP